MARSSLQTCLRAALDVLCFTHASVTLAIAVNGEQSPLRHRDFAYVTKKERLYKSRRLGLLMFISNWRHNFFAV